MKLATFNKHKDRFDTNNPYDAFIKQAAKRTKVPDELRTRKVYIGKSAAGLATPDKHHFLDRSLFPKKGTPTIKISRSKHEELQALLANAISQDSYSAYEAAVKAECPQIEEPIAEIYLERISALKPTLWRSTSKIVEWEKKKRAKRTKNVLQCPMC